MTARLPIPGSDDGTWGAILNDFLVVSHNSDGTLRSEAIQRAGGVTSVNTITPQASGNVTLTASNVGAVPSSQVGAANGVASLDGSSLVPKSQLGTGAASSANYLRGDGTWQSVPSGQQTVATKSSAYTLATNDGIILANAASSGFTLTLPSAVGNANLYDIKKIDSSANAVTIAASGGQMIDGGATAIIKVQYASVSVVSDGSNWYII